MRSGKYIIFFLMLASCLSAEERVMISLSNNYMLFNDKDYQNTYGYGSYFPELRFSYFLDDNLLIWSGLGLVSNDGNTPVLQLKSSSHQYFISLGGGYVINLYEHVDFISRLGLIWVYYDENVLTLSESGDSLGIRLDVSLQLAITDMLFIEISCGYLTASDKINNKEIDIGGFKTGIDFGIKL